MKSFWISKVNCMILLMTNEVSTARHEFYDVVGYTVQELISHELDVDFTEDELYTVLRHLSSGKSPGWDDLTNEGALNFDVSTFLGFWSYASSLEGWSN